MDKDNKYQSYSGTSIAEQLLRNTRFGKWLSGNNSNTYTDGYGTTRENATLKESANGQELNRMNDTAKKAATIAMVGTGATSIPALARYAVSLPQIAIPEIAVGLGTGTAGAKVGEKVGQALGGDGYWGSLIGGLGIGAAGVKGLDAIRSAPKIVGNGNALGYRFLKETPKINNHFISEIESGTAKVIEHSNLISNNGKTFRLGLDNPNATFRTTRKGFRVPTNVSENEALGISKGERNQPYKPKSEFQWSADEWFRLRENPERAIPKSTENHNGYTRTEVETFKKNIPLLYKIEREAKLNGTWDQWKASGKYIDPRTGETDVRPYLFQQLPGFKQWASRQGNLISDGQYAKPLYHGGATKKISIMDSGKLNPEYKGNYSTDDLIMARSYIEHVPEQFEGSPIKVSVTKDTGILPLFGKAKNPIEFDYKGEIWSNFVNWKLPVNNEGNKIAVKASQEFENSDIFKKLEIFNQFKSGFYKKLNNLQSKWDLTPEEQQTLEKLKKMIPSIENRYENLELEQQNKLFEILKNSNQELESKFDLDQYKSNVLGFEIPPGIQLGLGEYAKRPFEFSPFKLRTRDIESSLLNNKNSLIFRNIIDYGGNIPSGEYTPHDVYVFPKGDFYKAIFGNTGGFSRKYDIYLKHGGILKRK